MITSSTLDDLSAVPFHDADDAARAAILRRLADTELYAALAADPRDDVADLMLFDLDGMRTGLACDDAAELAGFVGGPVAHAAVPGRVLAAALSAEGRGLLVNPGRPSQMLLDPDTLGWLVRSLDQTPAREDARPVALLSPAPDVADRLGPPLAARLADMGDLLSGAALVQAEWPGGARGHLLVIEGAVDDAAERSSIARAIAELIAFLPPVDGGLDVTFDQTTLPTGALRLQRTGEAVRPVEPEATKEPDAPPRLRW